MLQSMPFFLHACDFCQHNAGIDYNAVAQHVYFIAEQYAGRQQAQFVMHVVDHNGMAGVGTAGVTDYRVSFLCQIVNNFAFSFIAPLGA